MPSHEAPQRRTLSTGSRFEQQVGYSRAVVDGDWVFVAGTTGFDYAAMTTSDDVAVQADQAMRTIARVLAEAGSSLADIARVRYILPDIADFEACWPVLRKHLGATKPAATVFEAGLFDPRMKIEIEVTARIRSSAPADDAA